MDLKTLTISKAKQMMESGELTSVALVQAYLDEIKNKDGGVHAYLEVFDDVLLKAKEADDMRKKISDRVDLKNASGPSGVTNASAANDAHALLGIPFAIKDNILIEGRKASAASKILENYVAPYDATAIKKLRDAGAVFIGRVNMDEFAMGGSTENSAYGATSNPHDIERVAGGSSGGSAAAVAMDGALASLGSDTGGSIRQPASFCGVVGLKPTYGYVSRLGLIAMGSSLDVIGPITKSVEDAELIFNIIKNETADRYDATSSVGEGTKVARPVKRIGIVSELMSIMNAGSIDAEVFENFNTSVESLKHAGYEIVEISLPHIKYSLPVYYVLMPAEVSSNMARFDGVKYGSKIDGHDLLADYCETRGELLGKEVRRRIMLGTYVLSSGYYDAYYNKANIVRSLLRADFEKAFEHVDVILTPTAPTPAFKKGSHTSDPMQMYLEDVFTVTANLVGSPAISIPSGWTEKFSQKLPLGIQFTAPHFREDVLFEVGKKFEEVRDEGNGI